MKARGYRFRRLVFAMVAILLVVCAAGYVGLPTWRVNSLRQACAAGDRLVVDTNPFPQDMRTAGHQSVTAKFEFVGTDKVADFLNTIELERSFKPGGCKCFGDIKFTVYRGDTELAELSIQHEKAMRWWRGRWSGDQPLTQSGLDAVSAFLVANGCPTPGEARAAFVRARDAMLSPP